MSISDLPDHDPADESLPAIGQPREDADPAGDPDFADEHDETAVSTDIITDADARDREPEAPRGWSGMQR
ncbi:hypothetical protein [Plantactinospora sp. KBS50]|uniref:hypothetical protein n=1 Tax=Plantactinospora sp. KBS50 TaxID=2024580 RepID=UPI000BAAD6BB|nr:hypothetical protein [Plantactinospora sp. KBS50]ASW56373.1 hypothetical protein CIK06_22775 [Plantactinospora sp. KBS50]